MLCKEPPNANTQIKIGKPDLYVVAELLNVLPSVAYSYSWDYIAS